MMSSQYLTVKECFRALDKIDISPIYKLLIEAQLVSLKRLLLSDRFLHETRCDSCSEETFQELLVDLKACQKKDVGAVIDKFAFIVRTLAAYESKADNNLPGTRSAVCN